MNTKGFPPQEQQEAILPIIIGKNCVSLKEKEDKDQQDDDDDDDGGDNNWQQQQQQHHP